MAGTQHDGLEPILEALRRALLSEDHKTRCGALRALGGSGERARAFVPEILRAINGESIGLSAGVALQRIDPEGAEAALVELLRDPAASAGARAGAAGALRQIEASAPQTLQALADALVYPENEVADAVITALSSLRPHCSTLVPAILEMLEHPAPAARRNAAQALGQIRWPEDRRHEWQPVAVALARALKDPDPSVRLEAVKALQHVPGGEKCEATDLASLLGDPDTAIRTEALRVLQRQPLDKVDVVHALAAGLQDQDLLARVEAALGFAYRSRGRGGDESLKALFLEALAAGDSKTRSKALEGLWHASWREESTAAVFTRCLKDPDPEVRSSAARHLSNVGRNSPELAKAAVPALLEALNDSNEGARFWAADALVKVAPGDSGLHNFLRGRLKEKEYRLNAASMLLEIGVDVDAALRTLLDVLKGNRAPLHFRERALREGVTLMTDEGKAAQAILEHAPPREDVARELRDLLDEKDPVLRVEIAQALLRMAPGEEAALAAIAEGASHVEAGVRHATLSGLRHLVKTEERVLPILLQALEDPSRAVRAHALWCLEPLSNMPKEAIPCLTRCLQEDDTNSGWRLHVLDQLGSFAADARTALPAILELLKSDDSHLRSSALIALVRIGPTDASCLPALLAAAQAHEASLREWAILGIRKLGRATPGLGEEVLRILEAAVGDPEPGVRMQAAFALADKGKATSASVDVIRAAAKDGDDELRAYAAEVLRKLGL